MHGLINRSLQCFLRDSFGAALWQQVAQDAGAPTDGFEALGQYDAAVTEAVLVAVATTLNRDRDGVLEDLGTYMVSHATMAPLRRLLRYGGICFEDFLHALPDLPDRARLAVPDLELPAFDLQACEPGRYTLRLGAGWSGFGPILIGALRAMADDYGALVVLGRVAGVDGADRIGVEVLDLSFASGRQFDLALPGGCLAR